MPRTWGVDGLVHGRTIDNGRFQFVFPTEELMETVLRRGPWAFADRMLVLQRWNPHLSPHVMNLIPFWVQIRGIPFQYITQNVITHIGRALGPLLATDYSNDAASRVEFVRVCLNWNINVPLCFQQNFQFVQGVDTLLRLRYERLRGFCEICGMITHDSGACVINNGGTDPSSDSEDDRDGTNPTRPLQNQGVVIEEVEEEEDPEEATPERDNHNNGASGSVNGYNVAAQLNDTEMADPQANQTRKRKFDHEEASSSHSTSRQCLSQDDASTSIVSIDKIHGLVVPKPPNQP